MAYKILSMESIAQSLNNYTYTDYYNRLSLLSRVRYEWDGLPEGIEERWIEKYLYHYGKCVFFKDENLGLMVARCSDYGQLNNYDENIMVRPEGTNYNHSPLLVNDECIVIKNNDDSIPTYPSIQLFAFRLANVSRTSDVNINALKTPVMILCSEKQRLTMKKVLDKVDDFEVKIFGAKDLDLDSIKTLKLDTPVVFDKLNLEKHAIWNECMTYLGINNANQDKRERLVDDEVQANNEQVEYNAQIGLKARQLACEQINRLYGTNISVKLRDLDLPTLNGSEGHIEKEVSLNE